MPFGNVSLKGGFVVFTFVLAVVVVAVFNLSLVVFNSERGLSRGDVHGVLLLEDNNVIGASGDGGEQAVKKSSGSLWVKIG